MRLRVWLLALLLSSPLVAFEVDVEEETARLKIHSERHYDDWPRNIRPQSIDYVKKAERRREQIGVMVDAEHRYKSHIINMNGAVVTKNLTQHGWALTRIPSSTLQFLLDAMDRVPRTPENSTLTTQMGLLGPNPPLLVNSPFVRRRVGRELQHIHEDWVGGQSLTLAMAFGIRVYLNESQLSMHLDNPNTHIVSSIIHVAHSDDSDPWPLVLEDFSGNTVVIEMTGGDMVLYESSKVFHGRPKPYRGSWYASIFLHYHPTHNWNPRPDFPRELELTYTVPKGWENDPSPEMIEKSPHPALRLHGMGWMEPTCPDFWCGIHVEPRLELRGPGEEGVLLSAGGRSANLSPKSDEL